LGTLSFTWTANPVKPSFVIKLLSYAKTVKAQLFKLRRKKLFFSGDIRNNDLWWLKFAQKHFFIRQQTPICASTT